MATWLRGGEHVPFSPHDHVVLSHSTTTDYLLHLCLPQEGKPTSTRVNPPQDICRAHRVSWTITALKSTMNEHEGGRGRQAERNTLCSLLVVLTPTAFSTSLYSMVTQQNALEQEIFHSECLSPPGISSSVRAQNQNIAYGARRAWTMPVQRTSHCM